MPAFMNQQENQSPNPTEQIERQLIQSSCQGNGMKIPPCSCLRSIPFRSYISQHRQTPANGDPSYLIQTPCKVDPFLLQTRCKLHPCIWRPLLIITKSTPALNSVRNSRNPDGNSVVIDQRSETAEPSIRVVAHNPTPCCWDRTNSAQGSSEFMPNSGPDLPKLYPNSSRVMRPQSRPMVSRSTRSCLVYIRRGMPQPCY